MGSIWGWANAGNSRAGPSPPSATLLAVLCPHPLPVLFQLRLSPPSHHSPPLFLPRAFPAPFRNHRSTSLALAVAAARAHPFARLFSTSCPVSKPHLILHARIVDNIGGGLHSAADPGAGNINPLRFVPHSNRIGFSRESSLFFFLSRLFRTCFEECGLYRLLCIAGIMYVCMYVCIWFLFISEIIFTIARVLFGKLINWLDYIGSSAVLL